uniref:Uncharacterized protein n=1 Tax=Kwoniella pini CBS 10737 TaxID=1296096 RepID=A0A1B9I347_9TREE|nr:uncharacterized protein I206_04494 [Kwoniella pini CBS 10737]OCF49963.1 hypothetical protein I206_04494 [Kwoniella pini CBS 10737]
MKPSDLNDKLESPALNILETLAKENEIVFRIYTENSNSPLIWTGKSKTSGFSSPNYHLSLLTPKSYKSLFNYSNCNPINYKNDSNENENENEIKWGNKGYKLISKKNEINQPGIYLQHTILDHILNKSKQTCLLNYLPPTIEETKQGYFQDELTPWISTSNNLFWIIWEIIRILSIDKRKNLNYIENVKLAIIRHPISSTRQSFSQFQSNIPNDISKIHFEQEEETFNFPSEIWIKPTSIRIPITYPGQISLSLKESYEASRKAAFVCGEILFYGRIWAENVICVLEWTRETTPFELPSNLFQSEVNPTTRKSSVKHSGGKEKVPKWIDQLVWDPKIDEYLTALQKVKLNSLNGQWPF